MQRPPAVLLFTLAILGFLAGPSDGKSSEVSYPRYEPPSLEDLPVAPAPASEAPMPSEQAPEPADSAESPKPHIDDSIPSTQPSETAATEPEPAPEAVSAEPAAAPELPPTRSKPRPFKTYKVWIWQENGDTLWRIAQKIYGDKDKWPLIYQANRDVIKDPNKIYPKQKLRIPPPDWQP